MKTFVTIVIAVGLLSGWGFASGAEDTPLDKFHAAKALWDGEVSNVEKSKYGSLKKVSDAFNNMMKEWSEVPPVIQKDRYHELNRTAFTMAQLSADSGKYNLALQFLNDEMRFQYQTAEEGQKVFLSGQNRNFYQDVIKLEARVLGHLGRDYYLNSIDSYLMPIGEPSKAKLDSFVAMEEVDSDEEYGVTIPRLPVGEDRKILYLLTPDESGNYRIASTVQVVGYIGNKLKISLTSEGKLPVIALDGVTHMVTMKDGLPYQYSPLASNNIKFYVSSDTFKAAP